MIHYIFRRILMTIPVVLGVLTLTFLLIHFVPGDPIDVMLGDQANSIDKVALRHELGLDQPLGQQYKFFLTKMVHGNLGQSLVSRRPVSEEIIQRFPATLELTVASIFFALIVGVGGGTLAAIRRKGLIDRLSGGYGLIAMSTPGFWLGPMLILVFAIRLDLLPVSDRDGLLSLVLPAVSLGIGLSAIILRMTRASMLDVIREDYVRTARAKGLSPFKIYFKHALKNALMPILSIVGLQFGALMTGAVITETIFDWPGVGTLFYNAIQQRNYPVVQGCVLFISITFVVVNLLTDLAYGWINPRVRLQ